MGNYATNTSLSLLLPYTLIGNTTTSDTKGTAVFDAAVTRAEGLVNGYISARYSLPFSAVPPIIRTITEDIACYYFIRSTYPQDGERKNEYQDDFKNGITMLEMIRDGKTPLCNTAGSIVAQNTTTRFLSSTKGYAPTFNEDDPENWKIDSDKADDIAGDR